ncbi:isochorismatase family cysteine hydrolase [Nocardia sp. NPDC051911]|uniref:isochorismatase family cysteine hydrolase n=1 Tax=Nocardia sp. NPDC051911 TaxID=3154648 RepID=UPI003436D893
MSGVKFVRRVDGLTYEFAREGEMHGFPSYKRVDLDIWCRRLPGFGWVVCSESGEVSSRPFDDAGRGDLPPEGVWVSRKGDRSYVYDLIRDDGDATPTLPTHDWHIEAREYARHESRRGRRFAYPDLDPERTALAVIDMVPLHVSGNAYCRAIVPNINRLADALRTAGGTVAWVVPASGEPAERASEFFGPKIAETYSDAGTSGPLPTRLWPDLATHDDDLFVDKSGFSAFFPGRCVLPQLLEQRHIDTVLITGTVTNVCCESSARDAATLDFRVIMVADANAARRDRDHNAALHTIYRSFGDVRPASDVLTMLDIATQI